MDARVAVDTDAWSAAALRGVADSCVLMLDPDGRVVGWNAGARRLTGHTAEAGRSLFLDDFYLPESVAAGEPASHLAEAVSHGQCRHEGWRRRRDGSRFWGEVLLTAVVDEAGQVRGFGEVTRDATVRREAQQALQDSEDHFHVLEASVRGAAIVMLDAAGTVVSWNSGAHRLTGYEDREVVAQPFAPLFAAEDAAAGVPGRLLQEAAASGQAEHRGWRVRKDGTRFWGAIDITAIFDDAGHVLGYGTVTRDVGGPPHPDEPRTLRPEDLRRAVEGAVTHAVVLLDPTGVVTGWNAGAEQITGYPAEEVCDQRFDFLYLAAEIASGAPQQHLAEAAAAGHLEYEGWRRRKDGNRFWADTVLTAVLGEHGEVRGFGKVMRDASVRKLAEQAVRDREQRVRLLEAGVGPHAIVMLDPAGLVTGWSAGAQQVTGHTAAEVLGQS